MKRQAIIWINADKLLIGTNLSEILFDTRRFSFNQMRLDMPSAKWRSFLSALMC